MAALVVSVASAQAPVEEPARRPPAKPAEKKASTPRKARMSLNRAIAARASEKIAAAHPATKPPARTPKTPPMKNQATVIHGPINTAPQTTTQSETRLQPKPAPVAAASRRRASSPSPESTGRKRAPAYQGERAVVQPVVILDNGRIWKMAGNHAVAYVRTAANACAILKSEPGQLAKRAMAVYRDRNGKAIAWQVRFETARWAEVEGMLK